MYVCDRVCVCAHRYLCGDVSVHIYVYDCVHVLSNRLNSNVICTIS